LSVYPATNAAGGNVFQVDPGNYGAPNLSGVYYSPLVEIPDQSGGLDVSFRSQPI